MLSKNKLRVLVGFVVVTLAATALVMLATYSYIKKLRADNKELYAALVVEDRIIRDRVNGCKILLDHPVVKRIMKAK